MRRRDAIEAVANAGAGLLVSVGLVEALRAAGLWGAPSLAVAAVFFIASVTRAYALRRLFRGSE